MELQPHQQRVVTEKGELDEKIGKLFGFITSENFEAIVPQSAELAGETGGSDEI